MSDRTKIDARWIAAIAGLVAVCVALLVGVLSSGPSPAPEAAADDELAVEGFRSGPKPWPVSDDALTALLPADAPGFDIGTVSFRPGPAEEGAVAWTRTQNEGNWSYDADGGGWRQQWRFAAGNPQFVWWGRRTIDPTNQGELELQFALPAGEVAYAIAGMPLRQWDRDTVSLPGRSTTLRVTFGSQSLTVGPWRADSARLEASETGTTLVLSVWVPELHTPPTECDEAPRVELEPRVSFFLGAARQPVAARMPGGLASAIVPVFGDPPETAEPRLKDGSSANPGDFSRRARTVALGHSSPADARYGNGGVGTAGGGAVVVPADYAGNEAITELTADLSDSAVDVRSAAQWQPKSCEQWLAAEGRTIRAARREFDGKLPTLSNPAAIAVPWKGSPRGVESVALSGRRQEVTLQTLSRAYVDRMTAERGLAVVEIPIIATRNPLVAAAGEALLEPERQGHWTLQEDVVRALAELELTSETGEFGLLSLTRAAAQWQASEQFEAFLNPDGSWSVDSTVAADRFSVVFPSTAQAQLDGQAIEATVREEQTWITWSLATRAQKLEVPSAAAEKLTSIRWQAAD